MTPRERNMAVVLVGLIVLAVGGFAGYLFIYEPLQEKKAAMAKLQSEIADQSAKLRAIQKDAPRLAATRKRSLPADEFLARREYNEMLSRLVRQSGVPPGFSVVSKTPSDVRSIPVLPGTDKKPVYTKVVTDVEFKKADMWSIHDFLQGYYKLNLLQQITSISIKREDDSAAGAKGRPVTDRRDLTLKITTEAIILDGAERRRTLLPVSNAFAGVGGWAGYDVVALSPEMGRALTPLQFAPVLATKPRDYTLLVQRDPFHGPYPKPEGLGVDKITDVAVKVGEPLPTVKIPVKGEPGFLGKVTLTAKVDDKLFPAGSVKIDQAKRELTLTPVKGETGKSTVTVIAKAENGQEVKTTFRVEVAAPVEEVAPKVVLEDISPAIILIAVSTRSDGSAVATVRDNANKLKYEIELDSKGVKVSKYYYLRDTKKKDPDYETPELLVISDESSSTNRSFKVVALDTNGLVLQDVKPAPKVVPGVRPGGPGPGGARPGVPGGKAPAVVNTPLAAVVGVAGSTLLAPEVPVALLRWAPGKSLKTITPVPAEEAKEILKRASTNSPAGVSAEAPPAGGN